MAEYRCPVHDCVFQAETDITKPGSKPEHNGCHPDCPVGQRERKETASAPSAAGRRKVG